MKKLGLIGGVGYMSTLEYYRSINEGFAKRINSASKSGENPCMTVESLNLADAYELIEKNDLNGFAELFIGATRTLHAAGAEFAAIAANTAHIVFDQIVQQSPLPLVGIVDATCMRAKELGFSKLIVMGTKPTMTSGMYTTKCQSYGIEAIVPASAERDIIQNIIFPNLEAGIVLEHEKASILAIAKRMLKEYQADALVLGCTELNLIIKEGDLETVLLDTGAIHIEAILDYMLA